MRRLWRALVGPRKPRLVIPTPVIGPSDEKLRQLSEQDWENIRDEYVNDIIPNDSFMFGAEDGQSKQFIMRLPKDPLVFAAMYNGLRPPKEGEVRRSVTYDPERASELLTEACFGRRSASIGAKTNERN